MIGRKRKVGLGRVAPLGVAAALALGLVAVAATDAQAAPTPTAKPKVLTSAQAGAMRTALRNGTLSREAGIRNVCADGHARCQAQVVTAAKGSKQVVAQRAPKVHTQAFTPPVGYGADELAKAYGLTKASSTKGTIVVIGAGAYPTLESDLAIYRSTYDLPACTADSGCFKQINYKGGAPYKPATSLDDQFGEEDIAVETALDVDMASAACPKCKIISMQVPLADGFFGDEQATHDAILHFATGVQTAKKLGAAAVSISYGYPTDTYSDSGTIAKLMTQPGLPIVSSSGDDGFLEDVGQWPQSLSTVTSAGGTSLYPAKSSRGYTETAWNGAGSGCTYDVAPAAGQPKSVSTHCDGHRAASDLSAVADPYTGVAVYDSYAPASGVPYGFLVVGGTSAASPFLAGLYARAPKNTTVVGPSTIYAAPKASLNDITVGSNQAPNYCSSYGYDDQLCVSGPGWDGPTGVGSPKGLAPFAGASS